MIKENAWRRKVADLKQPFFQKPVGRNINKTTDQTERRIALPKKGYEQQKKFSLLAVLVEIKVFFSYKSKEVGFSFYYISRPHHFLL